MKLVTAVDLNWGIGKNNQLPWYMPEDLKLFKDLTMNSNIIMGRSTFESFKKPLPNRHHVVLSTQEKQSYNNVTFVRTIDEVIAKYGADSFVIGGASIYKQLLPFCSEAYITYIFEEFECDIHFPIETFNKFDWYLCDDYITLEGAAICHYQK